MTSTTQVLKNVTARAWNDIEPKLIAWLTTGLTVTGLIQYGDVVGVHITPAQGALAVVVIGTIAGYFKHSTTTVPPVDPVSSDPVQPVSDPTVPAAPAAPVVAPDPAAPVPDPAVPVA